MYCVSGRAFTIGFSASWRWPSLDANAFPVIVRWSGHWVRDAGIQAHGSVVIDFALSSMQLKSERYARKLQIALLIDAARTIHGVTITCPIS